LNGCNPSSPYFGFTFASLIGCWLAMGFISIITGFFGWYMMRVHWSFVIMGIVFIFNAVATGILYWYLKKKSLEDRERVKGIRERWHQERSQADHERVKAIRERWRQERAFRNG
jgi:uncharacterized membrane protein